MVSVRKRGKVYEYRFEIATVEGTRKWITKSGYPTKAEAFKEGAKAYNDFYYNGQKTQLRENMSYADFLDYWIDNYASFNLHYSTTISYINIIKNHVKPRVGFYKLWQLDTRLLQEFINKIYVEYGFSKNYMASILKVVKGSLKYACYTLNYINTNPAEHVHAPRIDKIEKDPAHIFTQEEIERILDRFKGTHSIYYAFLTAYYTGMRVSEVYGLTWDCVDFEKKTLTINKNIIKKNQYGLPKRKNITKGHSVGVWYYGDCKNPQSRRTISIGDTLVNALKDYKKEQEENRKFYGDSYLSGFIKGFEVVPYPYIVNVTGLPEEVGKTYEGKTLFTLKDGKYIANYNESLSILEYLFPKDKNIFLMCGAGGYAGSTKEMLVALGWDENKIYNIGGYWYYNGNNNVEVKRTTNNKTYYDFYKINYHNIDFTNLTKVSK